jgi:glycosyltransferase involved in cell wall biosynthesis
MSRSQIQSDKTIISLLPLKFPWKIDFVNMLSEELSKQGYAVRAFRWKSFGLQKTTFIVLHWPDEFFVNSGRVGTLKSFIKLGVIHIAKLLWRTKLVWVAHNAAPHDAVTVNSLLRRWFLRSLDGVVFLSQYSRTLIADLYPEIRTCNSLVTVHGHYRGTAVTREAPWNMPSGNIRLVHFGQIRPYKNIEALVDAVSSTLSGVSLVVAGMVLDRSLCAALQNRSRAVSHIKLDFRDAPISDAELEAIVDSADAVVLPYKNILTSGAALLALSRNRPVLAPNIGSLPELRDTVGQEWIYLYDGEFRQQVLMDFREWLLSTKRGGIAPLDAYELSRIGRDLRGFVETMTA